MSFLRVNYVSKAGRERLQLALDDALAAYHEICSQRQIAFELSGDGWHDNPHFNHLQQLEANSTHRIAELRELLARTQVFEVADGKRPTDRARLGSIAQIAVSNPVTGRSDTRVIEIVGFQEGDESGARISYDAPLARVLLGRKPGDVVEADLPGGKIEIELIELFDSRDASHTVIR